MAENNGFCIKCGSPLQANGICSRCGYSAHTAPAQANAGGFAENSYVPADNGANLNYSKLFTSPKEKYVASIGNSYAASFLAGGGIKKGFAVLSDKRVYFKGRVINVDGKKSRTKETSKIVDLKDVTGTGVTRTTKYAYLVTGILALVLGIAIIIINVVAYNAVMDRYAGSGYGVIWKPNPTGILTMSVLVIGGIIDIILFFIRGKVNLLQIEFAGGCIAFDVRLYGFQACDNFQRMLRTAKDQAAEQAENATAEAVRAAMATANAAPAPAPVPTAAETPQPAASNAADDLTKYAELLEKKLITEEEFAQAKARIFAGKL